MGFFTQIKEKLVWKSTKKNEKYVVGLDKSSETFSDRINELAARFREINDEYFEELENILIMADVGVSMVMKIVSEIKTEVRIRNITDPREINDIIVDKMFVIYANESVMSTKINYAAEGLTVILMVGVNGAGKTTTIGKLAHRIVHDEGKKSLLLRVIHLEQEQLISWQFGQKELVWISLKEKKEEILRPLFLML